MGKNLDPRSGMNIPDLIFENLVSVFGLKIFKFIDADPDPGSCQPWIQDGKSRILNKHPGSATQEKTNLDFLLFLRRAKSKSI
jgi:hypothetical protein